jgi:hypothetical protein
MKTSSGRAVAFIFETGVTCYYRHNVLPNELAIWARCMGEVRQA